MSLSARRAVDSPTTKICAKCGTECPKDAAACHVCDTVFPIRKVRMKSCVNCNALNPVFAKECQSCGKTFGHDFEISLTDALRVGAIIRGMDIDEEEVQEGEAIRDVFRKGVLASGDEQIIKILRLLPEESYGRLEPVSKVVE